jgi:hypothetical protein
MTSFPFKNPQCPACCNKDTRVVLMVPMPHNADMDEYSCHCRKCGSTFHAVLERHVWLACDVASESVSPAIGSLLTALDFVHTHSSIPAG